MAAGLGYLRTKNSPQDYFLTFLTLSGFESCQFSQEKKHIERCAFFLAAGLGFEPRQTESESAVLPLHNPAIYWRRGRDSNPRNAINVYSISNAAPSTNSTTSP